MPPTELLAIGLILANAAFSYQGFSQPGFLNKYSFRVGPVRDGKEYIRLLSSGFLHVSWMHLFFNMYALYTFSQPVGHWFGLFGFVILYFGSLLGGNLLALYFRRNDSMYSAVGASGAVSGVVFAFILMMPKWELLLFFVLPMPAWLLGLGFLAYTLYGIKNRTGNLGHEAHLGGALIGMIIAFLLRPEVVIQNWWIAVALLLPTAAFLYMSVTDPAWLMGAKAGKKNKDGDQYWSRNYSRASEPGKGRDAYSGKKIIDLKPNSSKNLSPEQELDMLLDKVRLKGMDKLSQKEKNRLEELSKGLR